MSRLFPMSQRDAATLFGPDAVGGSTPAGSRKGRASKPRTAKEKAALPENIVESQILGFLRVRGWTVERQQAGTVAGIGSLLAALDRNQPITRELLYRSMIRSGAKGRADWVATRPLSYVDPEMARKHRGLVQRIEIETKAPSKKPSPEQRKYLEDRAAMGFLVGWFDSFEDDGFDSKTCFESWYRLRFESKGEL